MPQTDVKVVRCPNCNAGYNASSLPPGKSFRCKKCNTVVGGSAPEPASRPVEKKATSRLERKPSPPSTTRRAAGAKTASRLDRRAPAEQNERGTGRGGREKQPAKKNPMPLYIGGGVVLLLIVAFVAMHHGDEPKPVAVHKDPPKAEPVKTEKPHEPDAFEKALSNDTTGHETEDGKRRRLGSHGQTGTTPDPTAANPPAQDPAAQKPPEGQPPAKDPLEDDQKKDNK